MSKFQVGEIVTWVSQAQGYERAKTGKIIEVVAEGKMPTRHKNSTGYMSRKGDSYVVDVAGKTYWPRTNHLQKAL